MKFREIPRNFKKFYENSRNSGTLGAGPEYHSIIGSQEHIYHGTTAPSLPHPFILTVPLVATVPLSWATAEPSYGPPATNLTPLNFLSIKWNQKREGSLRGGHEKYLCFIVEPILPILFFSMKLSTLFYAMPWAGNFFCFAPEWRNDVRNGKLC